MTISDPELRAEYAYLVRGFLRLATQFEQDMAETKVPHKRSSKTAAWSKRNRPLFAIGGRQLRCPLPTQSGHEHVVCAKPAV